LTRDPLRLFKQLFIFTSVNMRLYPEDYKQCLTFLLRRVTHYMKLYGVKYILSGGSLLGAVRAGVRIPGDYDEDLDLLPGKSNRKRFFDMVKFLKHNGSLGIAVTLALPQMVKFSPCVRRELIHNFDRPGIPNPTLDVFVLDKTSQGEIRIVGGVFPKWTYKKGELYPLRTFFYEGMALSGPHDPIGIFTRYYGDWKTPRFKEWPTS